jgi:hypothetical protein
MVSSVFFQFHIGETDTGAPEARLPAPVSDIFTPDDEMIQQLSLRWFRLMKGPHKRNTEKFDALMTDLKAQFTASGKPTMFVRVPKLLEARDIPMDLRFNLPTAFPEGLQRLRDAFGAAKVQFWFDGQACAVPATDLRQMLQQSAAPSSVTFLADPVSAPVAVAEKPKAQVTAAAPDKDKPLDLTDSRMAPRNDIVSFDETKVQPPYSDRPTTAKTGAVIIACMKNEAPFILEWVAYHRAIGIDHILVYTNSCDDGTDELLDRLSMQGFVTRIDNTVFKGNSPQQHALNIALKHPVVQAAEWLIHIDADEFINIRTGDGTWTDLMAVMPPKVTNIAMTWRLFGTGGQFLFQDRPIIEQFTRCAPSFLPKPHTSWGFKTATRNVGAYAKLSCHRPNQLDDKHESSVLWANGSGKKMPDRYKTKGWRSDIATIGYDVVQINHYALRSADSFLVKRHRGRALHVDRTIGESYWTRMDWNYETDVTILRQLPRLQEQIRQIIEADPEIAVMQQQCVAYHRGRIEELKANPEFLDLYNAVTAQELDLHARVLAALENDMSD